MTARKGKSLEDHAYGWLAEPLAGLRGFFSRPMFGCIACYAHGRLALVLSSQGEPWEGVLVPTSREHHASLMAEFPGLAEHPVLGKWLYLSASEQDFEGRAASVVERIVANDLRLGVEPGAGKKRKSRARPSHRRKN
jgi:hypothetical protein